MAALLSSRIVGSLGAPVSELRIKLLLPRFLTLALQGWASAVRVEGSREALKVPWLRYGCLRALIPCSAPFYLMVLDRTQILWHGDPEYRL